MAISAKYFITDVNGNFIDWNQNVPGLSILGKEAQITGAAGADVAFVQAGTSADLSVLGGGNDKVYLTGNLADYAQTIDQDTGVYTFTRIAGLSGGQSEVVKITVSNENDLLYFANGHITLNAETDSRLFDGTSFQSLQAGWLTAGGTPATGPVERDATTTAISPARVFVTDPAGLALPGLPQAGQRIVVSGSAGADSAYVNTGTFVDASDLGGGNDKVYLMGKLADYSQSIDQDTGIYTLTRSTPGGIETVKVTLSNEDDVLYFADGHIVINAETNPNLFDPNTGTFAALTAASLVSGSTPVDVTGLTTAEIQALSPSQVAALTTAQLNATNASGHTVLQDLTPAQVAALTTTQLDAITPAQISALTPAQIAALTPAQIASLDTAQIGALTAAQVAALSTTQLDAFTAAQIAALSPAAVAALTAAQIASLDGTQVAAFTTTQLDVFTTTQIAAITPTAVAALTATQLASLDTTQIGALTAAQVAALTTTQLDAFTAAQIAALSLAAVAALTAAQIASLNATQVAAFTTTQLDVFSATQIAAIVPAAVAALTATQLASLDTTQIGALTAAQAAALTTTQLDTFTAAQIAALSPAAVAALTATQIASLNATQVAAFTTTQLDVFTATQIAAIVPTAVAALTATQLASLDATQIGALTAAQVAVLSTTQLDAFTAAQIAALSTAAVAALTAAQIASLNATQVAAFTTTQLDVFTATQIAAIVPTAVAALTATQLASLDTTQIGALTAAQVAALTTTQLDSFTAAQIAALSLAAVAALTAAQIASLDGTQVAAFTTTQLDVFTATQIAAIVPAAAAALTAAQLTSLDTTQIGALTAAQTAALTTTQLDVFTAAQIAALTPVAVAALTAAQVASLSATQVAALTTTQLDAVTATQIAAIVPAAVAALTVAQVASLDATQVAALTTTQLDAVTATQIAAIVPAAVAALTATQVASLDATQVAALTTTQLDAVTATQIAAIAPAAVAALTVAQVTSLDATQVAALTTTQLDAVTATQIAAIVPAAVAALTTTQVASLDATQIGALSTTQLDVITTTQIVAIAPAALAGTSVAQLTSLDNAQQAALTTAQLAALSPAQLVAVQSHWNVISAGDVSESAGVITYTVSRTGSTGAATLQFATAGGSATAGSDYTASNQTLSFAAGETSKAVTVTVTNDAVAETNEMVVVAISNASIGTIDTNTAAAAILDNDQSNWSVVSAGDVSEGAGFITYTVSRTGTTGAATIQFATAGGTATAGSDYTANSQTLSFAAAETSKNITVAVTNDAVAEGNETVTAAISNASTGNIAINTATATILDNDQSNWSVASAGDVDESAGFITYTVSRTGATAAATIQFATAGGTATAGSDYTASNQTLSFAAGETSKNVTVAVTNDAVAEGNETVTAAISNASTGSIATNTASATILDNDQSNWSVASAGDVDEGAGFITYTVSRTSATAAATIQFATTGGTATAGSDYTAASQTLSFAAGETSKTVTVALTNDAVAEGNETVVAVIKNASAGSITTNTATATILDNEQSNWSVASAGDIDEGAGFLTYTVSRTGATAAATIQFATAGGTATAGSDYTANSQTLSFAAGETSKTVTVAVTNDAVAEGNETVVAAISNASAGSIAVNTVTATILDNDQSNWSVANAGNVDEGAGFITYTVSRTGATAVATIQFATAGGTATAGSDYTAASQTLSFAAGETSKTITVAVTNDAVAEGNETVVAAISNASSGSIATNTATTTILDNDQSNWSVASAGDVDEGAGSITYTVSRTGATAAATIQFATGGGTATPGSDYTAASQTLSFAAGETSKTVTVAVTNDAVAEGNETVTAAISNASTGSIATNTATATILDNEQSIWSVASAGNADEGAGFLTYTVSRTGTTAVATIQFATAGGTATAGSDYTASNQTLSFAAGETSKTVTVAVTNDAVAEGNETVTAAISSASTGSIATNTATATILDNDQSNWSVASAGDVDEGAGFITYTVSRTGATAAATIQFATAGGTATAGSDYTAASQTLSFAVGETSKTVTVALTNDVAAERNETVVAAISNASTGSIATNTATATILDNEQSIWSVASAGDVDESAGSITYTVSRTGTTGAATIQFTTAGGTATAGSDYTAASQTLSFAAGETSKTVTVAVTNDAVAEANETVLAAISNASSGSIATSTATTTILDNDQSIWSVASAGNVDEGAGFLTYTVNRTGATAAATIQFATAGGNATAGSDYTASNQTLSFAVGETSKTVTVAVTNDAIAERNETVVAAIKNASAGSIATNTATAAILDNDQSNWSVASAGDVDEGAGFLTYTVSRTGSTGAATIQFATAGGTAIAASDYTAANQTLSFAAGETSKTVTVALTNDAVIESNETVVAAISSTSAGTIATNTATAVILDNDQSIWSFDSTGDVSEGAGFITYTVSRTGATAAATIQFAIAGGSSTAGIDYTPMSQTLSFAAGEMAKTVSVAIIDDVVPEGDDSLVGILSNASTGSIAAGSSTITPGTATVGDVIFDNEQSNWAVVSAGNVDEGAGFLTYVVNRTGALGAAVIQFTTAGGTAVAGTDYTATSQNLSFAVGETSKTVTVAVTDDAVAEDNQTVIVSIGSVSAGNGASNGGQSTAAAYILDNDQSNWVVASAGNVGEGAGFIAYTVSRTGATAAATIQFATAGGTATAGSDYTANSQILSFAAGETSKTVMVAVTNDAVAEGNESVVAAINNASTGNIATGTATASILDNDQSLWSVVFGLNAASIGEGAGAITYIVSRTGTTAAATIEFATAGGSTTAGSDYTATSQVLSFAAGETTKTVTVAVTNDAVAEDDESLRAAISNASSGSIGTATYAPLIRDDEQSNWSVGTPSFSGNSADEGAGFIAYTVSRLNGASAATIVFSTAGGSAMAGTDYTATTQTLSFAAGETSQNVLVAINDDAVAEGNETILAVISNASTGNIAAEAATTTILDNDLSLWSVASTSAQDEGAGAIAYVVSRTGAMGAATITFSTTGGSAMAGSDYTATSQVLSFAAGESTKVVTVAVTDDAVAEASETVIGFLSNASTGNISATNDSTTILDNDVSGTAFTIGATVTSVFEDGPQAVYTITRSGDVSGTQTIEYFVSGGTASAGSDYTAPGIVTVTFAAGEINKIVNVDLLADAAVEGDETLILGLRNASAGSISTTSATVTLLDDDTVDANTYSLTASSGSVYETEGMAAFTVVRSGDASLATTSYFRLNGGTATADSDYVALATQTLSWAAGESSKVVLVDLTDDASAESTETIIGQTANDSGFTTGTDTATVNILDNDTAATGTNSYLISTSGLSLAYESTGIVNFQVTRSGDLTIGSTSYFRTNGGTATAGTDFTAVAGQTLSWGVGETVKVVSVALSNDAVAEGNETVIGQSATDSGFTTGTATATATLLDDDAFTTTVGVADTLTTGTVSGSYLGGSILSTGDLADTVTIGVASRTNTVIDLGSGNDTLDTGTTQANFFVHGAQYIGGTGVDTLALNTTTAFNFATQANAGNFVKGFEIVSMAAAGNQTLNLSLADVLEFTSGNAVANTLRITGTAGDVLNLQALGKTLSTLVAGTGNLTDVDGTTYNVVASAAGNAAANDVTIGGTVYDVYQYQHSGQTATMLINTALTTNVI